MWLIIHYLPATLFSLRYSSATSTGAKSLLIPSPYTIKMALVAAAIRWRGIAFARGAFNKDIRDLHPIRIRPPQYAVANRCFLKYQKPREDKTSKATRGEDYEQPIGYQSTVGFREYVYLHGMVEIALPVSSEAQGRDLLDLAVRVNYFGKRGSLVQFVRYELVETLSAGFTTTISEAGSNTLRAVLQPLDDMAHDLTFDKIDVTSDITMRSADRPSVPTVLPYRPGRAAVGYASYTRIG